jgi:putative flavoprotein involved in K+ transport
MSNHFDVIIVGGGQAGLAMGYHLKQRGLDFVILDAEAEVGAVWRRRWDSLTLFTPASYSALPGMAVHADPDHMPRKDEVADYLVRYARHFELPIRHRERVVRLEQLPGGGFQVETTQRTYQSGQVVVATGPYQQPNIPAFAAQLAPEVVQLHSSAYRSPAQLPADGDVLVVGGGNSGLQIATELAQRRRTWLSIGKQLHAMPERMLNRSLFWWLEKAGFMSVTVESRLGRRSRTREFLIGKSVDACAREDGVLLLDRAVDGNGRAVITSSGKRVAISAVVWATGYRQEFSWVQAPIFDGGGHIVQRRGVTDVRGLYILGLPWQHTRGSSLIGWVGRDAEHLAQQIAAQRGTPLAASATEPRVIAGL